MSDQGVRLENSRQSKGCVNDIHDYVFGTKGIAELMEHTIKGGTSWSYGSEPPNMYKQEHLEIWAAMRAGKPINDGESAANSSMMAILGRMCTYSGQRITWEEALASRVDLSPKAYEWGPAPEVVIGGGVRGSKLFLPGSALLALPGAELVDGLGRAVA